MQRLQCGEQLLKDGWGMHEYCKHQVAYVCSCLPDVVCLCSSLVKLAFMARTAHLNTCLLAVDWGGVQLCCGSERHC